MNQFLSVFCCALVAIVMNWAAPQLRAAIYATKFFNGSVDIFDEVSGDLAQSDFITGLNAPSSIRLGPDQRFYVASRFGSQVFVFEPDGQPVNNGTVVDGLFADLTSSFAQPGGLAFDAQGQLFVSDNGTNTIFIFDGSSTQATDTLLVPNGDTPLGGITFDSEGDLYISSFATNEVFKYDGNSFDTFVAAGAGGLANPAGLAVADDGTLYVAGLASNAVHIYDNEGVHLGIDIEIPFEVPPGASFAPSNAPSDVQIDAGGDVLIAVLGSTNPSERLPFPLGGLLRYDPATQDLDILTQNTGAFSSLESAPAPSSSILPGDFNGDNVVDAADYTLWQDNLGSNVALPNDDGLGTPIGRGHYDLWVAQFGEVALGGGAGLDAATVPEPSTGVLSLCVVLVFTWFGRVRCLPTS